MSAVGVSTSSAALSRTRHSPRRKSVVTGASPGYVHAVSIRLRACVLWVASSLCGAAACDLEAAPQGAGLQPEVDVLAERQQGDCLLTHEVRPEPGK